MNVAFPILIIVAIIVLLIILKCLIPSKGAIGEKRVARILEKLSEEKYSVINNLLLNNSGYTSQVDHVVVSVYGIFVIETKTYQGTISGGENSEQWTQNIYGNKYEFRNPILQNYGHIKNLKQVLGDYKSVPFISIVAFSRQANSRVSSNIPVVYWSQLLDVIKGYENPVIKESDVRRITRLLIASNTDSQKTRKDHVKNVRANVKKRQGTIASGKCPRCGGDLILRIGKYGLFTVAQITPNVPSYKKDNLRHDTVSKSVSEDMPSLLLPNTNTSSSLREVMCCGVIQSFLSCHSAFTIFHYLMLNNVIKAYSDSDSSTLRINVFDNYTSYMLEPEKVEKHHLLCRHFRDGQARSLYPGHSFFERLRNLSWLQLRFQDRFHIQLFQKCC